MKQKSIRTKISLTKKSVKKTVTTSKKDYGKLALLLHKKWKGKLEVVSKVKLDTRDAWSTAYTPGEIGRAHV